MSPEFIAWLRSADEAEGVSVDGHALAWAAWQAALAGPRPVQLAVPCKGMNCGSTDGVTHSAECQAEHAAAISGGYFVEIQPQGVLPALMDLQYDAGARAGFMAGAAGDDSFIDKMDRRVAGAIGDLKAASVNKQEPK